MQLTDLLQSASEAAHSQSNSTTQAKLPSQADSVTPPSDPRSRPRGLKAVMLKMLNGSQAFSIQPAGHAYINHASRTQPSTDSAQPSLAPTAQRGADPNSPGHRAEAKPSLLPVSTSSYVVGHQQGAADTPTHRQTGHGDIQQNGHLQSAVSAGRCDSASDSDFDGLDSLLR